MRQENVHTPILSRTRQENVHTPVLSRTVCKIRYLFICTYLGSGGGGKWSSRPASECDGSRRAPNTTRSDIAVCEKKNTHKYDAHAEKPDAVQVTESASVCLWSAWPGVP